jgi:hypothetical protein
MIDILLDQRLDPAELTAMAVAYARSADGWRHQVRFDEEEPYTTMLYADRRADVWLNTWLPGQGTQLQRYSRSASSLIVVDGRLDELRFSRAGWRSHRRHRVAESVWIAPGTTHALGNRSRHAAVSINAYSPPLWRTSATSYDVPVHSSRADELVSVG